MASKKITMVDGAQVAKKGYKGCKSTRSVQNFCAKNKSTIDCCWYKPKGASEKVLLIEMSSFRDCWKASQKSGTATKSTSGKSRTTTLKTSSRGKTTGTGRTRKTNTIKLSARTTTSRSTTGRAKSTQTRTTRLRRAA